MCCSEWGWCGQTADHCSGPAGPTDSPVASPTDNPATSPTGNSSYDIASPALTLTRADIQAGLDKFNQLQGWSAFIGQSLVDNINSITSGYTLYRQLALVAQTMWESAGYQFTEEMAAVNPPFATRADYQDCEWNTPGVQLPANGKHFYGRGYIQLSWCANYIIYGQDRLVDNDPLYFYKNPELVATTSFYAFDSAAWFFETQVLDTSGQFGSITNAINGNIECSASYSGDAAEKRYTIFEALAQQVGLTGYNSNGCY
jgi:predicted chitinase